MKKLSQLLFQLVNKIPSAAIFKIGFSLFNKTNAGMVIALHRVTATNEKSLNDFIEISAGKLESIILELQKLGVLFISLNELSADLKNKKFGNAPVVHLSFDDGYFDNYTLAFPILKKYKIPFSIFITSDFINNNHPFLWWYLLEEIIESKQPISFDKYNFSVTAADYHIKNSKAIFESCRALLIDKVDTDRQYIESQLSSMLQNRASIPAMLNWENIKEMQLTGLCEIGIHSKSHPRFKNISLAQKAAEINHCKEIIRENTGITSTCFAYPYGANDDIGNREGLKEILTAAGIEMAFTTIPGELNAGADKFFVPRVFINSSATSYTLRSRLNGSYQRRLQVDS